MFIKHGPLKNDELRAAGAMPFITTELHPRSRSAS